jgi:hypothetical protein
VKKAIALPRKEPEVSMALTGVNGLSTVCQHTSSSSQPTSLVPGRIYRAFSSRCIATDLTLFDSPALPRRPPQTRDLAAFVAAQDILYLGGGAL